MVNSLKIEIKEKTKMNVSDFLILYTAALLRCNIMDYSQTKHPVKNFLCKTAKMLFAGYSELLGTSLGHQFPEARQSGIIRP
jgi:hypothetical protein